MSFGIWSLLLDLRTRIGRLEEEEHSMRHGNTSCFEDDRVSRPIVDAATFRLHSSYLTLEEADAVRTVSVQESACFGCRKEGCVLGVVVMVVMVVW